jgi:hypothetical protein
VGHDLHPDPELGTPEGLRSATKLISEEERPGSLLYRFPGDEFALYGSAGTAPGTFTQMAVEVDDLDTVVADLKRRGVVFPEVDLPGLRTAEVAGDYPSKGG